MISKLQAIAVQLELETAVRLIHSGLGHIQRLTVTNDFFHLPLMILASGVERYLKVTLCLQYAATTGEYPHRAHFPTGAGGHNLELLLNQVIRECFSAEYVDHVEAGRADFAYLQSQEFMRVLEPLSAFALASRYYHMNAILGGANVVSAPEDAWHRLELGILADDPRWLEKLQANPEATIQEINRRLVTCLERFCRAIARLYTLGPLRQLALPYSPTLRSFWRLMDPDLGGKTYGLFGEMA